MNQEKLIESISKGKTIADSKELYDWVSQSEENEKQYIRHKNLWAILQRGNEMDSGSINRGYTQVKQSINKSNSKFFGTSILKYAAVIAVALLCGYLLNSIPAKTELAINEIVVPKGNRMSVVLPDGTKVWLSNGTTLKYPEHFNEETREVELEGEGFFEVSHDKEHPFIVNVGENRIKVLGTKFAVVAYPEDNTIRAELVSGKIQFDIRQSDNSITSLEVKPQHSLVFVKTSGKIFEKRIPEGFYDYWQYGTYTFKDESLASLAQKIERIYNVEIIFESECLKQRLFTGTFNIDDNIYTLMEVFKKASGKPFEYRQEKGQIYVKIKN
jgi:ferric-dicitrate binding protein FerR (iron transport regulator)